MHTACERMYIYIYIYTYMCVVYMYIKYRNVRNVQRHLTALRLRRPLEYCSETVRETRTTDRVFPLQLLPSHEGLDNTRMPLISVCKATSDKS